MPLLVQKSVRRRAARLTSLAVLSSLAAASLALTGCNHTAATDNSGGGNSITTSGSDAGPVATLVTPKGNTLTLTQTEFYDQLQGFVANSGGQPAPVGAPVGRLVIQQMLQNLMFEGLAQDQGVAPTDAEVDQQYNNIKLIQEARSTKPFDQLLSNAGLTPDILKSLQIKPQLAQLNLLTKGATVSDADIQTFYNANKDKLPITKPACVHLAVILTATLPEAQQISKAITGGQTFQSQVAQSLDKSSPDGDLPQWLPLDNPPPTVAPLIKAVRTAAIGSVSAPVALPGPGGQTRYALVKLVERVDKPQTLPLDQVKDLIRVQLLQQKAQADPSALQSFQQALRDFQGAVKITTAPQYASVVQLLTHPAPPPPSSFSPGPGGPAPGGPAPGGPAPGGPAPGSSPFAPAHP